MDEDCHPDPDCDMCNGSGRVPFENDDYPPGTNACHCTSAWWRAHHPKYAPKPEPEREEE